VRPADGPTDPEQRPIPPTGSGAPPRRRLTLGDPLAGTAAEDRPESWGERAESDAQRLSHYRSQRPPHHEA